MRVAVTVGHNPDSPGAAFGNVSEYSEMSVLAGCLVQQLQRSGHKAYLIGTGSLEKKATQVNRVAPDCAVSLHLNAGGGRGYETLYYPRSEDGLALAKAVNSSLGVVLNSRNRGAKEGWYHANPVNGPVYFLARTECPAIIVESYFLDNPEERAKYLDSYSITLAAAKRIAAGILRWGGVV